MTEADTRGKRAALYLRASTAKKTQTGDGEEYRQRPEIQEERLRRLCDQRAGRSPRSTANGPRAGRKRARK